MTHRVSLATLLTTTSLSGPQRVGAHFLVTAASLADRQRVAAHYTVVTASSRSPYPVRVSGNYLVVVAGLDKGFYLNILDADNEFYSFEFTWSLVAGQIPEINPYKPQVPESLIDIPGSGRDLFDYIEENQKTLRLQHNITQAGDTTFPHEMIINSHDVRQFKLGSVGRFYHEDYGVMQARYVQFDSMNPALVATAPVGLIKQTGKLDWIVTNRLELSDADLVVGVQAAYTMPIDGQFGWAIVNGVNLQPLTTEGDSTVAGTPYVWSASGKVSPEGKGVVICRRLFEGGDVTLLKGKALIRLEGASFGSIDVHFAQLLADVEQLKADVELLNEASNVEDTLKTIQASLKALGNRINLEQSVRAGADTAINNRIDALEAANPTDFDAALATLRAEIAATVAALSNRIDVTNAIALEALEKANQALAMDLGAIQTQISNILIMFLDERVRVKGRFPIVDGSIPPNLVYTPDGSLVYVETF